MELLYVFNAFPFAGEVTFQITFLYFFFFFDIPVVQQHLFYVPMHHSWWLYSLQEMETIIYF